MPAPNSSTRDTTKASTVTPDPGAPAGSPDSLGAESVRDGRPSTCDDVVEAMDEAGPGPK